MKQKKRGWRNFFKAVAFVVKDSPAVFPMAVVTSLLNAAYPYIGILLSSVILTELVSKDRDIRHLVFLAILLVGLNFIGTLLKNFCGQLFEVLNYVEMKKLVQSLAEKAWKMDYAMLSDVEINGKREAMENWIYSNGVLPVIGQMKSLLNAVFTIGISVTLVVEFFAAKAVGEGRMVAFLNNWMFPAVFLLFFLITTLYGLFASAQVQRNRYGMKQSLYVPLRQSDGLMEACCSDYQKGKDIRLFEAQPLLYRKLKAVNDEIVALREQDTRYSRRKAVQKTVLSRSFHLLVYFLVGLKACYDAFGVGSLLKYSGMVMQLGQGIEQLCNTIRDMLQNFRYIDDYFEYIDLPNRTETGTLPIGKEIKEDYEFEVRNLTFTYPGAAAPSLSHVSCKFRKGEKIAVVGKNGSGKTTFIKLLCRLYDPQEGEILLNGVDIREYRYEDYLRFFSTVFQDYCIFAFKLGENVAAESNFDAGRVKRALEEAGFGERLKSLENGIDTKLFQWFSEDGVELSGGESQKVAIARCLYKNAPFVILDEPTAALDPVAEADIYQRMNGFIQEKGAIYISHRLSSCHFCNRIFVFEEGSIVEQGTHEELLLAHGLYQKLWNAQAQYYV